MPQWVGIHVFPCCDQQDVDGGPSSAITGWVSPARHVKQLSRVGSLRSYSLAFSGFAGSPHMVLLPDSFGVRLAPYTALLPHFLDIFLAPLTVLLTNFFGVRRGPGPHGDCTPCASLWRALVTFQRSPRDAHGPARGDPAAVCWRRSYAIPIARSSAICSAAVRTGFPRSMSSSSLIVTVPAPGSARAAGRRSPAPAGGPAAPTARGRIRPPGALQFADRSPGCVPAAILRLHRAR
jgi:hypothetical protein